MAIAAKDKDDVGGAPLDHVQFLVVDDHAFVRQIVLECLKNHDMKRCAAAQDGGEALEMLTALGSGRRHAGPSAMQRNKGGVPGRLVTQAPDFAPASAYCVIADFRMPGINGLELLKAIRCGDTKVPRDTPYILLTGFADAWVVAAAKQFDVSGFVVKPVSQATLWTRIERALKAKPEIKSGIDYRLIEIQAEIAQSA